MAITAATQKALIGLLGDRFAQIPQRAAEMKQGLLAAPSQLAELFSPEMAQKTRQAMVTPTQANPQQWMDKGMELSGMAPVGGLMGTFIGKTAKTWDAGKAQQAEELLARGVDPREVWSKTGTLKGVDDALMQEIPDNLSKYDVLSPAKLQPRPMSVALSHDSLYSAYPDIANIPLYNVPKEALGGASGAYSPVSDAIQLSGGRSPAIHEIQHAIQKREGWDGGGSPERMRELMGAGDLAGLYSQQELNNAYRSLAGESLARLTQARINMTMPERLQSYPPDMFDVPPAQQIIRRTPRKIK